MSLFIYLYINVLTYVKRNVDILIDIACEWKKLRALPHNEESQVEPEKDKISLQCRGICDRLDDDTAGGCRSFIQCDKWKYPWNTYDEPCLFFTDPFDGTEKTAFYETYGEDCLTNYRSCPG